MIKIEYEILYRVPFSDPVEFQSHVSGNPDIRTRICESEGALHKMNTCSHYQYDVRKVWEVSDEDYEKYMDAQRSQHRAIERNFRAGVE